MLKRLFRGLTNHWYLPADSCYRVRLVRRSFSTRRTFTRRLGGEGGCPQRRIGEPAPKCAGVLWGQRTLHHARGSSAPLALPGWNALSLTRWQSPPRLCRLIFAPPVILLPSVRAGLAFSGEADPP